jgi:ribonuclease Z
MFRPTLVNGRSGDPLLFVEIPHERDALLFDLGDCSRLAGRNLLRVRHVFVSHMHMDHFVGFDALLRANVGREKALTVVGPEGVIDAVGHRLAGYTWDLAARYSTELEFEVRELHARQEVRRARFCFRRSFAREDLAPTEAPAGRVVDEAHLRAHAAICQHHGPCLAFRVDEPVQVKVWPNRLAERGLPQGPWLKALKQAILEEAPDTHPVALPDGTARPLRDLRDLAVRAPGHSIGYVTDVRDSPANRATIAALCGGVDALFIEASFAAAQADRAQERAHLTTSAAGEIARAAGARRVEPFHFSPRNDLGEEDLLAEVRAAFER